MLLFIHNLRHKWDSICSISIHLMLLFICSYRHRLSQNLVFQYISCYCLSNQRARGQSTLLYFNTSHVTVYRLLFYPCYFSFLNFNTSHVTVYLYPNGIFVVRIIISIHLMLLFINISACLFLIFRYFNTSHVTVYRIYPLASSVSTEISIHLMLLFISTPISSSLDCTCISIHLMLLFIFKEMIVTFALPYFNTSHVTVYRTHLLLCNNLF